MKIAALVLKQLLTFFFVQIPLQLIGSVVVGIYLLAVPSCKKLPTCLKWFDGADQYVGRDTSVYDKIMAGDLWTKYCWLCWRNPLNYMNYSVFGFRVLKRNIDYSKSYQVGDPEVGDSTGDHPGTFLVVLEDFDGKVRFEYYKIIKWSATKCFRFRIGWKIGPLDQIKDKEHVQDVLILQPFRSYAGV